MPRNLASQRLPASAGFTREGIALLPEPRGRPRDVHPIMWVVSALFVVYFAIDPIREVLGV